ncbi:hypothetical protein P168DRAFT_327138 [Aspergillus campestris IBT 28561]|uniref:Uncharacterized protein n=1 Tax=Aspergillus campestris (strain IBT 28561) TaxID=1392248 RepID=A0A2I1D2Q0_ASPC2|nr:uncharacterized protein P168DRAFT_327138 [Aspergillus campestris IBT 28561]PKY04156.1 hypothetical protein P168DRAFT_327138 [Aspergillus campestris IBT 28561]
MSDFKYTGYIPDRELIVEIDKILRAAGIPSVLWYTGAMDIYGVPTYEPVFDFVIPDHQMDAAVQTLKDAGFSDGDGKDIVGTCYWQCRRKKEDIQTTAPWPCHWFHLHTAPWTPDKTLSEDKYNSMLLSHDHADLCLHRKSETFWALPDPSLEDPAPDDPNYMLATDPRVPVWGYPVLTGGRYTVPGCRVQIPTPSRCTESLILDKVRKLEMVDHGFWWERHLMYMKQYVYKKTIDEGFLSPATLDPSLGKIWKAYLKSHAPVKEFHRKYFTPLPEALIRKGTLPDTAVPWVMTADEELVLIYARAAEDRAIRERRAAEKNCRGNRYRWNGCHWNGCHWNGCHWNGCPLTWLLLKGLLLHSSIKL